MFPSAVSLEAFEVGNVSVTFSAMFSCGRRSFSRILPNTGRAARGFMKSSNSSSFSAMGLHLGAPEPPRGASVSLALPSSTGSSSKLTRTFFFFFLPPSSDPVSDASLGAKRAERRPFAVAGEPPRRETEGELFKTDFAGETERGSGSCLVPASSTGTAAKWAVRGGLSEAFRSCASGRRPRPWPLTEPAGVELAGVATGVARRGYELSWFGANLGEATSSSWPTIVP